VHSFKSPTQEEKEHDFLWRIHRAVPDVGTISIFDRSHYEDIIMPTLLKTYPKHQIEKRYDHINNFEQMLEDEGIVVVKFFLNVSEDAQLERLHERMTNPRKMWKYNEGDWSKREDRKHILEIAEEVINRCDTVPRHIIPSDVNWYKVNQIAKVIVKRLKKLDMKWPKLATNYSSQEASD
jgi:polyphosphate kinase 2 (PPK2 family)